MPDGSRRVFITGGSSGLGLALARHYLEQGDVVGVCSRSEREVLGGRAQHHAVDVTDGPALKRVVESFASESLDVMVINAGVHVRHKTPWPDVDVARKNVEVNVLGAVNALDAALGIFRKRGRGRVVLVASVVGFVGLPGAGGYSASKAALLALGESYRIDLARFGIVVTTVAPGPMDTPMTRGNPCRPYRRLPFTLSAEAAARRIAAAEKKGVALAVFPWPWACLSWLSSRMPRPLYRALAGRLNTATR